MDFLFLKHNMEYQKVWSFIFFHLDSKMHYEDVNQRLCHWFHVGSYCWIQLFNTTLFETDLPYSEILLYNDNASVHAGQLCYKYCQILSLLSKLLTQVTEWKQLSSPKSCIESSLLQEMAAKKIINKRKCKVCNWSKWTVVRTIKRGMFRVSYCISIQIVS